MSADVASGPVVAESAAKKPKAEKKAKAVKPKAPKVSSHPPYGVMIKAAVVALKDKKGSSRAALLKYILQNYKVGDNLTAVNAHLRQALKRGVTSGSLKQTKGVGASGSFRLGEGKGKAEPVRKPKKPAVKKASAEKKVVVKKAAKPKSAAKPAAKPKSEKKAKPSSPKKKKAVVKPKKAASPKKAKVAKPKAAKKSAPKAKKPASKAAAAPKAAAPKASA